MYGVFRHQKGGALPDFHNIQYGLANELVYQTGAAFVGMQGEAQLVGRLVQEPRFRVILVAGELQTVVRPDIQILYQLVRQVHAAVDIVEADASAAYTVFGRAAVLGVVNYEFHFFRTYFKVRRIT